MTPRLVLTAAHCIFKSERELIPKENLKVIYGLDDLANLHPDFFFIPKIIRKVKEVKVHPDYEHPKAYSDLMLIEVDEVVPFSPTIYPVCLPSDKTPTKDHLDKQFVTTVGYGPEDEGYTTMTQISQKIRSFGFCKKKLKGKGANKEQKKQLKKTLPRGFMDTLLCSQNR